MQQIFVRQGKGGKDRRTLLPELIVDDLLLQVARVKQREPRLPPLDSRAEEPWARP